MGSDSASMDDALGDTLVVEPMDFLHSDLVFKKSRTGALGMCNLQPDMGRGVQHRRIGKGRVAYHVWVFSKGMPCMVVKPREG